MIRRLRLIMQALSLTAATQSSGGGASTAGQPIGLLLALTKAS